MVTNLAESSKEGHGSKTAVLPVMMMKLIQKEGPQKPT
jgi:hypothetical protein